MSKEETLSYFINKNKKINSENFEKKIRIAILGSSTVNGIQETLRVKCAEKKIGAVTFTSGYNQYNQEILNKNGKLYSFNPDLLFLILDSRSILGDIFFLPNSKSTNEKKEFVNTKVQELIDLINFFVENSNSKLVITNFCAPTYSPYGICELKMEYGLNEMIYELNKKLVSNFKNSSSVYVFDFNSFVQKYGEKNVFDYKQYFFGDIKIAFNFIPFLVDEFVGYILPIKSSNRKCIVLDLDNTLWGGVVGEDGFNGIKLGPTRPGNAFMEFQKYLLALYERGIILAINSKNNEDEAMDVVKNHPHMILRENNFACFRINWNDKIANMKDIAEEINIGLDSLVFIDDDPVNREIVKKALPEVLTFDLPSDPSFYIKALQEVQDFNVLKITKEDSERGKMYVQERKRSDLKKSTPNLNDYFKDLDIKVTIKNADQFTIPRISQLTLKTNQFNLTTKRYQEDEIYQMVIDEKFLVGCAQVEDKFGNSGITGVYIIKKENEEWLLDTFLLSCRVMGRGIEEAILENIISDAKKEGISKMKGEYIATKKNKPCEDFLKNCGFVKDNQCWVRNVNNEIKIPNHIQLQKQ